MTQINTETIHRQVLEFLEDELGEVWNQLSDLQKDQVTKTATAYARESVKLVAGNLFQDIDRVQVQKNIEHITSGLVNLGASFESVIAKAINKAVRRALTKALESVGGLL